MFCPSFEGLAMWVLYGASPRLWTASGGVLTSRPALRLTGAALCAALDELSRLCSVVSTRLG